MPIAPRVITRSRAASGFTLVELVIVVVIIGMIASMAIPRLSNGSRDARLARLGSDLITVRKSLEYYAIEHGGAYPGPTETDFANQLTQYTDKAGTAYAKKNSTYIFGPYLDTVPECPVGPNSGSNAVLIDKVNSPPQPNESESVGWVYNPNTGEIIPNMDNWQEVEYRILGSLAGVNGSDEQVDLGVDNSNDINKDTLDLRLGGK
ncbi:MAG: prepilin-type N-terminal cleavage/methylation domain-containing protein [Phycisphaerales bacterium]|nr:prepilin-type N-terminal cleavage/methylation domain-containing protein [Phycisphaerales bacterium]